MLVLVSAWHRTHHVLNKNTNLLAPFRKTMVATTRYVCGMARLQQDNGRIPRRRGVCLFCLTLCALCALRVLLVSTN